MSNFLDDAARWAGQEVGDAGRDITQDGQAAQQDWNQAGQDVRNAPDNAANLAGREVGGAERDVSNFGQDVGSAVSGAVGQATSDVQDVEGFGQGVQNSFDQGEQQG